MGRGEGEGVRGEGSQRAGQGPHLSPEEQGTNSWAVQSSLLLDLEPLGARRVRFWDDACASCGP